MPDIVQVSLRGTRKEFFLNSRSLWLRLGDKVVVQGEHGETLGQVFLKDPALVALKKPQNVSREIIRRAEEEDLDQDDRNRRLEDEAFDYALARIEARDLAMALSEVEVTFRRNRITFYFTAEHRVDFRQLVRDLAQRFATRVQMMQVGSRDEAGLLGGVGVCGRTLCCSSWLQEFRPISIQMAKRQSLSLNPSKISGQCGRLLCCLAYEDDQYKGSKKSKPDEPVSQAS